MQIFNKAEFKNIIIFLPLFLIVLFLCNAFSPSMYVTGALTSRDLGTVLEFQSGGSLNKQLFWIFMLVYSCALFTLNKTSKIIINLNFVLFVSLFVFILSSVLWTDHPFILIKRFILQIILVFIMFFSIASLKDKRKMLDIIFFAFSLVAIYNFIFIMLFPSFSFDASGSLTGIHKAKNYLGFIALSAMIFSVHRFKQVVKPSEKKFAMLMTVLWFIFLLMSQSKTCLVVSFVFIVFWVSKNERIYINIVVNVIYYILLVTYLVLPIISIAFFGEWNEIYISLFESIDLTGRGGIWLSVLDSLKGNSIFGIGYGSFWGIGEIPYYFDVQFSYLRFLNQSHNGYLDIILQIGFVGMSLFLLYLFKFIKSEFKALPLPLQYMMVFSLIHNFTESSLYRDTHLIWVLLLIIFVYSLINVEKHRQYEFR